MPTGQKWESRDQAAIAAGHFVYCGNISFSGSKDKFAEFLSLRGLDNCTIYWPIQQDNFAHKGWCNLQFPDRTAATDTRSSLSGLVFCGREMRTGPRKSGCMFNAISLSLERLIFHQLTDTF
jgi:RNA recognition motif-containing protein